MKPVQNNQSNNSNEINEDNNKSFNVEKLEDTTSNKKVERSKSIKDNNDDLIEDAPIDTSTIDDGFFTNDENQTKK